jgi:hypothetical protein
VKLNKHEKRLILWVGLFLLVVVIASAHTGSAA